MILNKKFEKIAHGIMGKKYLLIKPYLKAFINQFQNFDELYRFCSSVLAYDLKLKILDPTYEEYEIFHKVNNVLKLDHFKKVEIEDDYVLKKGKWFVTENYYSFSDEQLNKWFEYAKTNNIEWYIGQSKHFPGRSLALYFRYKNSNKHE